VRFLAKSTLWKVRGVGPLLGIAGVLPGNTLPRCSSG